MPVVAVAASGGRDSTALLHCAARSAAALGVEVAALHVHHGLMPDADDWLNQVRAQCRRWGVSFHFERLSSKPLRGESVEAWARRERYRALGDLARAAGAPLVLLAHHRRDQAETWLLQALRGGGPAGLAAMPRLAQRDGVFWARPWLAQPREAVEAYVRRHRLIFAEDASNGDGRFARSRLRQAVWPALETSFDDAEQALASSAARAHEAASVLAEVAEQDLEVLRVIPASLAVASRAAPGAGLPLFEVIRIEPWLLLSLPRRLNVLRTWLAGALLQPLPETLLQRLMLELPPARPAVWPVGTQCLRLYRGELSVAPAPAPPSPSLDLKGLPGDAAADASGLSLNLSQEGRHPVPGWAGCFVVEAGAGVDLPTLRHLVARARRGGEQFQCSPRGIARSLKKQYQGAGVPAWDRRGPLLFKPDGALVFVPGLGLDARCVARDGALQRSLRWVPEAPEPTGPRHPAP